MAGDLLSETLAKLLVQGAHQASDAILTHGLILKLLAADRGDGAANSVTLQDPVEAFARIYAMMEGDLDELLRVLLFLEAIALERLGHRFRFAQHAVVHPGVRDIAFVQIELPDQPPGFADGFLIGSMHGLRQLVRPLGRHGRNSQGMALLEQQGIEEIRVVLLGA